MKSQYTIEDLSSHLFWDVDKNAIDFVNNNKRITTIIIITNPVITPPLENVTIPLKVINRKKKILIFIKLS